MISEGSVRRGGKFRFALSQKVSTHDIFRALLEVASAPLRIKTLIEKKKRVEPASYL